VAQSVSIGAGEIEGGAGTTLMRGSGEDILIGSHRTFPCTNLDCITS
jgi:hypothetical protein